MMQTNHFININRFGLYGLIQTEKPVYVIEIPPYGSYKVNIEVLS